MTQEELKKWLAEFTEGFSVYDRWLCNKVATSLFHHLPESRRVAELEKDLEETGNESLGNWKERLEVEVLQEIGDYGLTGGECIWIERWIEENIVKKLFVKPATKQ